jgi:hypothetical protein
MGIRYPEIEEICKCTPFTYHEAEVIYNLSQD